MVRNDVPLQLLECIESFKIEVKQKIHGTREHTHARGEKSAGRRKKNQEPTHFSNRKAMPRKESPVGEVSGATGGLVDDRSSRKCCGPVPAASYNEEFGIHTGAL
jgi:hypothetical protein